MEITSSVEIVLYDNRVCVAYPTSDPSMLRLESMGAPVNILASGSRVASSSQSTFTIFGADAPTSTPGVVTDVTKLIECIVPVSAVKRMDVERTVTTFIMNHPPQPAELKSVTQEDLRRWRSEDPGTQPFKRVRQV